MLNSVEIWPKICISDGYQPGQAILSSTSVCADLVAICIISQLLEESNMGKMKDEIFRMKYRLGTGCAMEFPAILLVLVFTARWQHCFLHPN
jgi:hypothetical protein